MLEIHFLLLVSIPNGSIKIKQIMADTYLKRVSIPNGSIKILFRKQLLTNNFVSIPNGSIKITKATIYFTIIKFVSIPNGSIKMVCGVPFTCCIVSFQFQMVRLKLL